MKDRHSRREFMGFTIAGVAGALVHPRLGRIGSTTPGAARWLLGAQGADPDLVVFNAKIYTMDPALARADAFAVSGGRFIAVGSSSEMKSLARNKTQSVDAKGMTIVPGFTDCHNHAGGTTLLY